MNRYVDCNVILRHVGKRCQRCWKPFNLKDSIIEVQEGIAYKEKFKFVKLSGKYYKSTIMNGSKLIGSNSYFGPCFARKTISPMVARDSDDVLCIEINCDNCGNYMEIEKSLNSLGLR